MYIIMQFCNNVNVKSLKNYAKITIYVKIN